MERIIGYHCAPALAGIKASNIVACYKNQGYDVPWEISRLNRELNPAGIYLEPVCSCHKRILVMVYRKNILKDMLENIHVRTFLGSFGYQMHWSFEDCMRHLKSRFDGNSFPHEIGVFLGYPMHDVYGFIHHKGSGCIFCGEWKVYANPEQAKKLFNQFSACRRGVTRRMLKGDSLQKMFVW